MICICLQLGSLFGNTKVQKLSQHVYIRFQLGNFFNHTKLLKGFQHDTYANLCSIGQFVQQCRGEKSEKNLLKHTHTHTHITQTKQSQKTVAILY